MLRSFFLDIRANHTCQDACRDHLWRNAIFITKMGGQDEEVVVFGVGVVNRVGGLQ